MEGNVPALGAGPTSLRLYGGGGPPHASPRNPVNGRSTACGVVTTRSKEVCCPFGLTVRSAQPLLFALNRPLPVLWRPDVAPQPLS